MTDPLGSLQSSWPEKTRFLGQVFNDRAASYKFYWLLGLLTLIEDRRRDVFDQTEIVKEMVVAAWHPVCFYRLSLGAQDKLQEVVLQLQSEAGLAKDATPSQIRPKLDSTLAIQARLKKLTDLVPTRFLSPWFANELRGVDGHTRTNRIIELAAKCQNSAAPSPYFFEPGTGSMRVQMNSSWMDFFTENQEVVRSFAYFHLCRYLQDRNPNVPGIVNKLTVPGTRDLSSARKFWRSVRSEFHHTGKGHLFHDIYSGASLEDVFSIDHFLPWSFVAHDLLWNLAPVTMETNSRKSDLLPDPDRYLPKLCALHHNSLKVMGHKPKLLEDYANWLLADVNGILEMSAEQFLQRYRETIEPQLQIAANQGFQQGWIWR